MKADFRNTFLLPFENGLINSPKQQEHWGLFNAQALPPNEIFAGEMKAVFDCEQSFRSDYLALETASYKIVPQFEKNIQFDHAVVFSGRTRGINEHDFQRAWSSVKLGGLIIVAGEKNTGIGSLRKWISKQVPIVESVSKHHAVCFWCVKNDSQLEGSARSAEARGLFAGGDIDKGSALLARHFDNRIKGKVADLGAGWGYLTKELLQLSDKVESVDLYEADWHSLEAAKRSLAGSSVPLHFHWTDIPGEFKKKPFEWIIMNPPFHHGLHGNRAADPGLGKAFIQTAASSLVQGGKLLMVANRNLPYEETLQKAFRRHVKLADEAGYKVFEAVK